MQTCWIFSRIATKSAKARGLLPGLRSKAAGCRVAVKRAVSYTHLICSRKESHSRLILRRAFFNFPPSFPRDFLTSQKAVLLNLAEYIPVSYTHLDVYKRQEFGTDAESVNAYAASSFYAVDRYASFRTNWGSFYNEGGLVLADRYTTSNAVHQCAKLPREHWDEYLYWLFDFEYNKVGIPKPDLVIYLDVDPSVSQKLMTGRYHGDEAKKDIHEKNLAYLEHSRASAQYCVPVSYTHLLNRSLEN